VPRRGWGAAAPVWMYAGLPTALSSPAGRPRGGCVCAPATRLYLVHSHGFTRDWAWDTHHLDEASSPAPPPTMRENKHETRGSLSKKMKLVVPLDYHAGKAQTEHAIWHWQAKRNDTVAKNHRSTGMTRQSGTAKPRITTCRMTTSVTLAVRYNTCIQT
jgi:hypothetical protein